MGAVIIKDYEEVEQQLNQIMIDFDLTTEEMITTLDTYRIELSSTMDKIKGVPIHQDSIPTSNSHIHKNL